MSDEQKMKSCKYSHDEGDHYSCRIGEWICTCVYDPLVARYKMKCNKLILKGRAKCEN